MKLLLISLQKFGGGAIDALSFSNGLIKNEFFHYIIISKDNELKEKFYDSEYRKVFFIKTFKSNIFDLFWQTLFLIRPLKFIFLIFKLKPDLIDITHFHPWCLFIFLLRPFLKFKIIYTLHENPYKAKERFVYIRFINFLEKIFLQKSDLIIVLNNLMKENISQFISPKNIRVLPLGIYEEICENFQKTFEFNSKLQLLFFGRIEEYKGLDILISAFSILKKENLDVELIIAGKGDLKEELKNKIEELKINLLNKWIDYKELCELLKKTDLLILPYKEVTQSGPLLIAFQYGVPVIASNIGIFNEYIKEGYNGFLFKVNDPKSLAEKIKYVYDNRKILKEISQNLIKESEKFNYRNITKEAIEILKELIKK